jgi:hypothetical protein
MYAGTDLFSVQLPGVAPIALTESTVNFGSGTGASDQDAACTGTYMVPTAPAGKVCIYVVNGGGVTLSSAHAMASALPTRGFIVEFAPSANSGADEYLYVSWAYRAP